MLRVRGLIFQTARDTDGVGLLTETLKWGQPSYLTQATKSGTTIRLGTRKTGGWGLYVHCQTSVMTDFRNVMSDAFTFDGNRGVLFDEREIPDENALRMLIHSALTYHQSR